MTSTPRPTGAEIAAFGDGYRAGWNSALEVAADLISKNAGQCQPTTQFILDSNVAAIKALIQKEGT
jgi:hypothetical protein